MRIGFLTLAAAGLLFAAPAIAFQLQTAPTNANGSAKFSDPDDVADSMAAHLAGDASASGSSLHFGGSRLSIGGRDAQGLSPALQERLMGSYGAPGTSTVPSR